MIVRDRWQCFEMAVTFAETAGHVTIWVDLVMVIDASGGTEVTGTILDQAILGVSTPMQSGLTVLDFDDFALAAERIGCN